MRFCARSVWGLYTVLLLLAAAVAAQTADPTLAAREAMVADQLAARDIVDARVLAAMRTVPRHLFMPVNRSRAYLDRPVPIGHDQTISQPYIVAFMTQALDVQPTDRVLEIGTGSGYQAAVLGELAQAVYSIEIVRPLADWARQALLDNGYRNVHVKHGDGFYGWPERGPFDKIIITAAAGIVPDPLRDQLQEGGLLLMPYEVMFGYETLALFVKRDGVLERRDLLPVRFVPMTGEVRKRAP